MAGRSAGFLGQLDPQTATGLLALGRVRRYPARSIVFFEGDDAQELLIVRSGQIKVFTTSADGREVILDVLGPGEILGELSAIDGKPRSATAAALTAAQLTAIELSRFDSFLQEHPAVAMALLRSVVGRLRNATRRQLEFGTTDALGRVCGRLVEMMARYGQAAADDHVAITTPLSQSEIAGWAGLSREAVVKALAALRALGWITTSGRIITIVDPTAVEVRAGIGIQ